MGGLRGSSAGPAQGSFIQQGMAGLVGVAEPLPTWSVLLDNLYSKVVLEYNKCELTLLGLLGLRLGSHTVSAEVHSLGLSNSLVSPGSWWEKTSYFLIRAVARSHCRRGVHTVG